MADCSWLDRLARQQLAPKRSSISCKLRADLALLLFDALDQVLIAFARPASGSVPPSIPPGTAPAPAPCAASGRVAEISRMRVLRTIPTLSTPLLQRFDGPRAEFGAQTELVDGLLEQAVARGELLVGLERLEVDRTDRHGRAQVGTRRAARSRCARSRCTGAAGAGVTASANRQRDARNWRRSIASAIACN